jgi:hypothetical protein
MLDRCMEKHLTATDKELSQLERDFKIRLRFARDLFGAQTFQYKDKDDDGKWKLSKPLYDGIMVAIDRLWARRDRLLSGRTRVVRRVNHLIRRPSAFEVIVGKPNTAKAVLKRMDLLTRAIKG